MLKDDLKKQIDIIFDRRDRLSGSKSLLDTVRPREELDEAIKKVRDFLDKPL